MGGWEGGRLGGQENTLYLSIVFLLYKGPPCDRS